MTKGFDKQAWLDQKQAKLEESKQALERGLRNLESSEDWTKMLTKLAQLGQLSIGRLSFLNALLVLQQMPNASQVGTYETWKRYGRQVKKDEKSISIRQPIYRRDGDDAGEEPSTSRKLIGFRLLAVFCLEQTEGEALPTVVPPTLLCDEVFENSIEKLHDVALALDGEPVSQIEIRARAAGDHPTAHGWYVPKSREIVVINAGTRAMQFKVLCHEIAHALLHPYGDHHSSPEREVEAESTAFIVCQTLGLETGTISFPYVATWAHGEDPLAMVARSGQRILATARRMLDALIPELSGKTSLAA